MQKFELSVVLKLACCVWLAQRVNLGCFQSSRTSHVKATALAQHFHFEIMEMHSWYLFKRVLSRTNAAEKGPFACCQSEGSASEMLVHFPFDRIISSIIEKVGSLAMWWRLFFMYCSSNCFFSWLLWRKVRLVNLTVALYEIIRWTKTKKKQKKPHWIYCRAVDKFVFVGIVQGFCALSGSSAFTPQLWLNF